MVAESKVIDVKRLAGSCFKNTRFFALEVQDLRIDYPALFRVLRCPKKELAEFLQLDSPLSRIGGRDQYFVHLHIDGFESDLDVPFARLLETRTKRVEGVAYSRRDNIIGADRNRADLENAIFIGVPAKGCVGDVHIDIGERR